MWLLSFSKYCQQFSKVNVSVCTYTESVFEISSRLTSVAAVSIAVFIILAICWVSHCGSNLHPFMTTEVEYFLYVYW